MKLNLTKGLGALSVTIHDPYWVATYKNTPPFGIECGLELKCVQADSSHKIPNAEFSVLLGCDFGLKQLIDLGGEIRSDSSACTGTLYHEFHNPIIFGMLQMKYEGDFLYHAACTGTCEFDINGGFTEELQFEASGFVSLSRVSVRGLQSENDELLMDRFKKHFNLNDFDKPVERVSIVYESGKRSRELLFSPKSFFAKPAVEN